MTIGGIYSTGVEFVELSGVQYPSTPFDATEIMNLPVGKRVAIATIASDFHGNRLAVAFGDAADLCKRVVSKVYVCPTDYKEYSAPGVCPTHFVALVPKKK